MLRINKKIFNQKTGKPSSDNFSNVIMEALNELPEPDLVSHEATSIDPGEAILCLQREIAYVDLLNPMCNIKHIKYVGSKDVHDCILLYIHTETDHLVAHVDNSKTKLNLYPSISAFTYKNYIEVYLVGGLDGKSKSINNIKKIIKELYDVAIKLNITIDITKQKVMQRNKYDKDAIYQTFFDLLLNRADIICRQFFSKSFNKNDLNIFSINDFKTRIINVDEEALFTLNILLAAREFYDKKDKLYNHSMYLLSKIPTMYSDKYKFFEAVKKVFSRNMFNELTKFGAMPTPSSELVNFVFDLDTKKIHVINSNVKTIDEELRRIQFFNERNKNYFVCYDGKLGVWNNIHLDDAMKNYCEKICDEIKNNVASKSHIAELTGWSSKSVTPIVYCSKYLVENSKNNSLSNTGFFSSKSAWKKQYEDHSVINEQLLIIRDLTELQFEAKIRHYPAYTVDAVYEFPSQLEAEKTKDLLHQKNILAHIIALKNDDNGQTFQLCVPAINAGQYATNIGQNRSAISATDHKPEPRPSNR